MTGEKNELEELEPVEYAQLLEPEPPPKGLFEEPPNDDPDWNAHEVPLSPEGAVQLEAGEGAPFEYAQLFPDVVGELVENAQLEPLFDPEPQWDDGSFDPVE